MNRYTGKIKTAEQPDPDAVAAAWAGVWLRRINNSHDPEGEMKRLINWLGSKAGAEAER